MQRLRFYSSDEKVRSFFRQRGSASSHSVQTLNDVGPNTSAVPRDLEDGDTHAINVQEAGSLSRSTSCLILNSSRPQTGLPVPQFAIEDSHGGNTAAALSRHDECGGSRGNSSCRCCCVVAASVVVVAIRVGVGVAVVVAVSSL